MQLTEQNAQQILVDGSKNKAVFVYFYANAPQCESTNKLVKGAIPDTNEYITLAEADVTTDVGQAIAMQLGLQAVPALVVLKNSRPVDALQGADSAEARCGTMDGVSDEGYDWQLGPEEGAVSLCWNGVWLLYAKEAEG